MPSESSLSSLSTRSSASFSSRSTQSFSSFSSPSYSSWSSNSSSSSSSSSASESSGSSETSAWDTGSIQYDSYVHGCIIVRYGKYRAQCLVSLTYDDTVSCQLYGPLRISIGGRFNDETVPDIIFTLCDQAAINFTFETYDAAILWIREIRKRISSVLNVCRLRRAMFGHVKNYRERTLLCLPPVTPYVSSSTTDTSFSYTSQSDISDLTVFFESESSVSDLSDITDVFSESYESWSSNSSSSSSIRYITDNPSAVIFAKPVRSDEQTVYSAIVKLSLFDNDKRKQLQPFYIKQSGIFGGYVYHAPDVLFEQHATVRLKIFPRRKIVEEETIFLNWKEFILKQLKYIICQIRQQPVTIVVADRIYNSYMLV